MKNNFVLRFFALLALTPATIINLNAQLTPLWNQSVDPSVSDDEATAITRNSSAIFIAGYDYSATNGNWRIEKRDLTSGNYIPTFGAGGVILSNPTSADDLAKGIALDQNAIYIAGIENQCLGCDAKWHIQKRDLNTGAGIWSQVSNPTINPDGATAITVDTSGVYIAGTVGLSFLNWAWRVEKRDLTTGALIWGHTWDISSLGDTPYAITLDSSGVYVIGSDFLAGNSQWRIEKRNLVTGAQIWTHTVNPSNMDDVAKAVVCDASGIYIGGFELTGSGDSQWRIEKRNKLTGLPIASFGSGGVVTNNMSSGSDEINGIAADASGIYATGFDEVSGNPEWRVEKRDLFTGVLICTVTSNPSSNDDKATSITVDSSGVYVVGMKNISFNDYAWRLEKYTLSCNISTNIDEIRSKDKLKIFPNPAADYLKIYLNGPNTVQIFDMQGTLLIETTVVDSDVIDISNLPSGNYFVRGKTLNKNNAFIKQ